MSANYKCGFCAWVFAAYGFAYDTVSMTRLSAASKETHRMRRGFVMTISRAPRRDALLFIHGINDDGRWKLVRVFEPFFECRVLSHRLYHCRGEIKLFIWPWAFLFLAALVITLVGRESFLTDGGSPGWSAYALVGVVLGATWMTVCAELNWTRNALAAVFPVLLSIAAVACGWLCSPSYCCLVLWLSLAAMAAYLEWREDVWGRRFPVFCLLLILGAAGAWWLLLSAGWTGWVSGAALAVGLMVAGACEPRWRRRRAIDNAKTLLGRGCAVAPERHLIGHSLGTFLIGHVLREDPALRSNRMIFLGSVLPQDFPWEEILRPTRACPGFHELRNEVGGRDLVVRMGGSLGRRVASLGKAGLLGFVGGLIHTRRIGSLDCRQCLNGSRVPIHNILLRHADHSSDFLHTEHARTFWLPFLWGIEPREYGDFIRVCWRAARAEDGGDIPLRDHQCKILCRRRWRWSAAQRPEGMTVQGYLSAQFPHVMAGLPLPVRQALLLWFPKRANAFMLAYRELPLLLACEVADAFEALSRYIALPDASLAELRTWFLSGGESDKREHELQMLTSASMPQALDRRLRQWLEPELAKQALSLNPLIAVRRAAGAALREVYRGATEQV